MGSRHTECELRMSVFFVDTSRREANIFAIQQYFCIMNFNLSPELATTRVGEHFEMRVARERREQLSATQQKKLNRFQFNESTRDSRRTRD